MEFQFVDTSVLIIKNKKNKNKNKKKTKKKRTMISLFILAYFTKHSLIFEGCSLGYLSLSSYGSLFRASTPYDTYVFRATIVW